MPALGKRAHTVKPRFKRAFPLRESQQEYQAFCGPKLARGSAGKIKKN